MSTSPWAWTVPGRLRDREIFAKRGNCIRAAAPVRGPKAQNVLPRPRTKGCKDTKDDSQEERKQTAKHTHKRGRPQSQHTKHSDRVRERKGPKAPRKRAKKKCGPGSLKNLHPQSKSAHEYGDSSSTRLKCKPPTDQPGLGLGCPGVPRRNLGF